MFVSMMYCTAKLKSADFIFTLGHVWKKILRIWKDFLIWCDDVNNDIEFEPETTVFYLIFVELKEI